MTIEQIEELGLKRRARTVRVKIREERIVGFLAHNRRVESYAKLLGERCFAGADGTFDRDVAEVHGDPMISSRREPYESAGARDPRLVMRQRTARSHQAAVRDLRTKDVVDPPPGGSARAA